MGHVTIEEFNPIHGYWNFSVRVDSNVYIEGTYPASKYGGQFRVTYFDGAGNVIDAPIEPIIDFGYEEEDDITEEEIEKEIEEDMKKNPKENPYDYEY